MEMGVWIWRAIGLAVVAIAAVVALWFMGQLGDTLGRIDLSTSTPTISVTPSTTVIPPSGSPSPSASGSATPKPSATPKR